MNALIGHTGFVGSNLREQHEFDVFFNSRNIEEIKGGEFDLLVCAGVNAVNGMPIYTRRKTRRPFKY